ncbi:MAG: CehA/McbA family metallohydrolase [Rubrivivax sp.]|nr:CehA/McbA family metallohydrolase [Rubrivivax sp.]
MTSNPFARPGRFFKGNLHTHSSLSDGELSPLEVCRRYREADYDFICLSDHFLPAYGFTVSDTRPYRTDTFTTILGAEVHVPATRLGEKWHLLANGLPLDFAPPRDGEGGPELARRCAEAGAFVTIVHPEWYSLGIDDAMAIDAAHAVEVYNHTSALRTSRGGGAALLDQLLAEGRRLNALATDDAHFLVDDAFGGWVMVKAERNEPELLVQALKAGHYYSTQGPLIEDIRIDGDDVVVDCSPAFGVYLLGRGSRADRSERRGQTTARLSAGRMGKGGFMRVVVVDDNGRSAWSNPLWRIE